MSIPSRSPTYQKDDTLVHAPILNTEYAPISFKNYGIFSSLAKEILGVTAPSSLKRNLQASERTTEEAKKIKFSLNQTNHASSHTLSKNDYVEQITSAAELGDFEKALSLFEDINRYFQVKKEERIVCELIIFSINKAKELGIFNPTQEVQIKINKYRDFYSKVEESLLYQSFDPTSGSDLINQRGKKILSIGNPPSSSKLNQITMLKLPKDSKIVDSIYLQLREALSFFQSKPNISFENSMHNNILEKVICFLNPSPEERKCLKMTELGVMVANESTIYVSHNSSGLINGIAIIDSGLVRLQYLLTMPFHSPFNLGERTTGIPPLKNIGSSLIRKICIDKAQKECQSPQEEKSPIILVTPQESKHFYLKLGFEKRKETDNESEASSKSDSEKLQFLFLSSPNVFKTALLKDKASIQFRA
jgi:hypothetical protein